MDFCKMVRGARVEKFKSARAFYKQAKLSCTYYYYSQIETRQRPELSLVLELIKALELNRRSALYAWVRDQMPDSETKSYFVEFGDKAQRSTEQSRQTRSMVLNRMQAKLLRKDPLYFEIMIFIYCHFTHAKYDPNEVAHHFKLPAQKVKTYLNNLFEYGLVDRDDDGKYFSKEWVFIPFDQEFSEIRDQNFNRAVDQFHQQRMGFRMRTTVTRLLTPGQQKEVESLMTALHNAVIDLPDETPPPNAKPFTLGVFGSERRFGNA